MPTVFSESVNVTLNNNELDHFFEAVQTPNGNILDIGCRTGEFVNYLSTDNRHVIGIDTDADCINEARKRYPHLHNNFYTMDMLTLDSAKLNKFDRIYCIGVMNYLPRKQWMRSLAIMQNALTDNGDIIVTFTKPHPLGLPIKALQIIPQKFYAKYISKLITGILYPLQSKLLSEPVDKAHFHYKFTLSLYGLTLGYPASLKECEIELPQSSIVTDKTAVFKISADYPLEV